MLVREYISHGNSIRKTAKDLKMSRHTIDKYLDGDPLILCRRKYDCNSNCEHSIEPFLHFITDKINAGSFPSEIHRELKRIFGYTGSFYAFYRHLKRNEKQYGWTIRSRMHPNGPTKKQPLMVSRKDIFSFLLSGKKLNDAYKKFIFDRHPKLYIVDKFIREFRDMFDRKCANRLHCFIENYSVCGISPIENFAKGLLNDIDAVELAVSSPWSNGFVEGEVNLLKLKKRSMFGRARPNLLQAMLLLPTSFTGFCG